MARLGGSVYLDMCDPGGRVVEVHENGWRAIHGPLVKLVRSPEMHALPEPEAGESVDRLRGW